MNTKGRRTAGAIAAAALLLGAGVAVVTPAGAALSSEGKQLWKQDIKPRADKRYFTKKLSNQRYYTKVQSDALYETKAAHDATLAGYYSKAESDVKYAPYPTLVRGTTMQATGATGAGQEVGDSISFGVTLSAAPTPHYIKAGDPVPVGCSGTPESPNAQPGHLCVFEVYSSNNTGNSITTPAGGGANEATPMGAVLFAKSAGAGQLVITTTWAVRPAGIAPPTATLTGPALAPNGTAGFAH